MSEVCYLDSSTTLPPYVIFGTDNSSLWKVNIWEASLRKNELNTTSSKFYLQFNPDEKDEITIDDIRIIPTIDTKRNRRELLAMENRGRLKHKVNILDSDVVNNEYITKVNKKNRRELLLAYQKKEV